MAAVVSEIARILPARVDRIYGTGPQRGAPEVVIVLFRPGLRTQLVISLHPRFARVHLSLRERPPAPPSPFVLLLRKHLEGARLEAARQYRRDRILWLEFASPLGSHPRLVVEIMGPGSNLVLLDGEGRILGAWRQEGPRPASAGPGPGSAGPGRRILLPGAEYEPPPPTAGWGPFATRELEARLRAAGPHDQGAARPEQEAAADGARQRIAEALWEEATTNPQPVLIRGEGGEPRDYWCLTPLAHGPTGERYPNMSQLLDEFYAAREEEEQLQARRAHLERALRRHRERQERLVAALEEDLEGARKALGYRTWGELLLAQAAHLPAGRERVLLTDYYREEPREVEIPLDPALSARENAREYFRRYARARRTVEQVTSRLERERTRLAHLEELEEALARAPDPDTLEVLERELEAMSAAHPRAPAGGRSPRPAGEPGGPAPGGRGQQAMGGVLRFSLPGGEEVLAGRGAEANDLVTFVLGRPDDVWLHARGVPGSHVILRPPPGRQVSAEAIARAAAVAAYFSRARGAAKVEVDWTLRKYVRRKPGAGPGQVLYREERTLLVQPAPPPGAREGGAG